MLDNKKTSNIVVKYKFLKQNLVKTRNPDDCVLEQENYGKFIFYSQKHYNYHVVFQNNLLKQNIFLVFVSYLFYGWWDAKFLSLIIFSTLVDYFIGVMLMHSVNTLKRKILLFFSIFINPRQNSRKTKSCSRCVNFNPGQVCSTV